MKWRGLTRFFLRWTLLPSAHRAPHARAPGLRRPPWPAGGRGACVVLRRIQVWNSCVWITSLCPLLPSPATLHCTRSYVCSVFLSGPIRPNIALAFAFAFKVEVFWEGLKIFKASPFIFDFYLIGHNVKTKWKICSNFKAFSEYMNFKGGISQEDIFTCVPILKKICEITIFTHGPK